MSHYLRQVLAPFQLVSRISEPSTVCQTYPACPKNKTLCGDMSKTYPCATIKQTYGEFSASHLQLFQLCSEGVQNLLESTHTICPPTNIAVQQKPLGISTNHSGHKKQRLGELFIRNLPNISEQNSILSREFGEFPF